MMQQKQDRALFHIRKDQEEADRQLCLVLAKLEEEEHEVSLRQQEEFLENTVARRQKDRPIRGIVPRYSSVMRSLFASSVPVKRENWERIHENPNIYLINKFLTENELQDVELASIENSSQFKRSLTEDDAGAKETSAERTSSSLFFKKFGCKKIEQRAADLVGLSVENVEPLQVVRYYQGEQYRLHHDCCEVSGEGEDIQVSEEIQDRSVRLITFFVYLNDVQEGGETVFPLLNNLKVKPKRGSALLFCNITPEGKYDRMVVHQAEPPKKGVKYGMNIWISHQSMMAYFSLLSNDASNGLTLSRKAADCIKRRLEEARRKERDTLLEHEMRAQKHKGDETNDEDVENADNDDNVNSESEEEGEPSSVHRKRNSKQQALATKRKAEILSHRKRKSKHQVVVDDEEDNTQPSWIGGVPNRIADPAWVHLEGLGHGTVLKTPTKTKVSATTSSSPGFEIIATKNPRPHTTTNASSLSLSSSRKEASTSKRKRRVVQSIIDDDDENPELEITFRNIFDWLMDVKGWTCKRGSGLVSWYYIPPYVDIVQGKPFGVQDEHYFCSQETLVRHVQNNTALKHEFREYKKKTLKL